MQTIGRTLIVGQPHRQNPFITSYERDTVLDLSNGRLRTEAKSTWPELDGGQSESQVTAVSG